MTNRQRDSKLTIVVGVATLITAAIAVYQFVLPASTNLVLKGPPEEVLGRQSIAETVAFEPVVQRTSDKKTLNSYIALAASGGDVTDVAVAAWMLNASGDVRGTTVKKLAFVSPGAPSYINLSPTFAETDELLLCVSFSARGQTMTRLELRDLSKVFGKFNSIEHKSKPVTQWVAPIDCASENALSRVKSAMVSQ